MTDYRSKAQSLLEDWYLYRLAKPREHVFDIQRDKDDLQRWAKLLRDTLLWDNNENHMVEACHQFESRLESFKQKIVIEILRGGPA